MKGRKTISILLFFSLTFNICSYVYMRAYYESCKEYITENFCVNKHKPQLHCNGQCHINKIVLNKDKHEQPLSILENLLNTYINATFIGIKSPKINSSYCVVEHNSIYHNILDNYNHAIIIPPPQSNKFI